MKRLILATAFMLLVAGGVQAQKSERKIAKKETKAQKTKKAKSTAKANKTKRIKVTSDSLNERRTYKANNGQRATPTGHEATGTGGGYASLKKDTAVIIPKDTIPKKINKEQ